MKSTWKGEKDRRCNFRLNLDTRVVYSVNNRYHWDQIQNVSAGGVFINTGTVFEKGDLAHMVFHLPKENKNRNYIGRVVHCTHNGIGIRY